MTRNTSRPFSLKPLLEGLLLIAMLCAIILYVWLAYQLAILIVLATGIRGQMEYAVLAVVGGAAFLLWRYLGLRLWRRGIAAMERIGAPGDTAGDSDEAKGRHGGDA
ncbi:MAG: hypothetical protein ACOCWR_00240 [Oceanidesulfovibrio sp.]